MTAYDVAGLVMAGRPDPREKVFTLCELVVAYRELIGRLDEFRAVAGSWRDRTEERLARLGGEADAATARVRLLEAGLGVI